MASKKPGKIIYFWKEDNLIFPIIYISFFFSRFPSTLAPFSQIENQMSIPPTADMIFICLFAGSDGGSGVMERETGATQTDAPAGQVASIPHRILES